MRAAMNAMLYLLRTGCPWRYPPRDGFPPRSTVYNIFRKFQREGVWEVIWAELHMALRERMGRQASPPAAVLEGRQEGEGAQDPRPGQHRMVRDAGRRPLRRDPGSRRGRVGPRQDTPTLPLARTDRG